MNTEPDEKRKRGRPSIPKSEKRIETKAMLPPLLVAKAKAVAKARGISYSEFAEEALTDLLFQEFLHDSASPESTPMITGLHSTKKPSAQKKA